MHEELTKAHNSLDNLAKRLERTNKEAESAQTKVKLASALIRKVGQADDELNRIIKQLKTLSNMPQLKMLPPVVKMLEGVHKQLHAARLKGDKFNAEALKPLDAKLKDVIRDLRVTIYDVKDTSSKTGLARAGLDGSRKLIELHGSRPAEVAGLERTAKAVRTAVRPAASGIATVDRATGDIEKQINLVAASLKALTALQPGIDDFTKALKPFNDVAVDLNKVLNKKLTINLFKLHYNFTVRQVLEGPKNIAGPVLKPLQAMADKALEGVMKSLHLKLQAPKEIREMLAQIEKVANASRNFMNSIAASQRSLDTQFLKSFQQSLAKLPSR